jgi:short-subunit dehydrogenase
MVFPAAALWLRVTEANSMRLHDKLILVTGASGGIGTILCRQLAAQGARLVMSCMDPQRLQALQHELGEKHLVVAADISRPQGRVAIADACKAAGGIDALVNLAGMLDFGLFQQQKPELLQKLFEVNTIGPIVLTRELLPQLLAKPQARIVNVGSIFGSIGHPGFAAYCASKAAIKSFSEALSRELADSTISVGYIAPRATRTALNSDRVRALNVALGNREDAPELVAREICAMLFGTQRQRFLGWPEKLFVFINAVLPAVVHRALVGKLPVIRKFAR